MKHFEDKDENSKEFYENIVDIQDKPKDLNNTEWVKYILLNTLKVYFDNILSFITISLIPILIFNIIRYGFLPDINQMNDSEFNLFSFVILGIFLIMGFFISVLATSALSLKINYIKCRKKINVLNCYINLLPNIKKLSLANLVFFVLFLAAALLSLTLFGLPLLFLLMVNFCFFNQMILFERMGPIQSFSGSYELVKGFRIRIFFVILIELLCLLFIYSLIWLIEPNINILNGFIFSVLEVVIFPITGIVPITGITTMLIYIDIKERQQTNKFFGDV